VPQDRGNRGKAMKREKSSMDGSRVSEMAIVDTFAKLIFGEDSRYSNRELMIIQAFRMVDTNVVFDSHRDMGAYLRALGVAEMIKLVTRVQRQLANGMPVVSEAPGMSNHYSSALNRRAP
jgi:hypothetical protein